MSEPFIGQLELFAFNFPPNGWAQCNGQLLQIAQNTALFSLLGTNYGGNGQTNFGLPDLRGRAALHTGEGPGLPNFPLGSNSGEVETTLTVGNLPPHSHAADLNAVATNANEVMPNDSVLAIAREDTYSAAAPDTMMSPDSISVSDTGGGQAFNNLPPYLVLNWCIALVGIFPSPG